MISGNDSANDIYVGTFPNKMKRLLMKMQIVLTILTYIIQKELPEILTFIDQTKSDNPYQMQAQNMMQHFRTAGYNDFIVQYMSPGLYHNPFRFEIKRRVKIFIRYR